MTGIKKASVFLLLAVAIYAAPFNEKSWTEAEIKELSAAPTETEPSPTTHGSQEDRCDNEDKHSKPCKEEREEEDTSDSSGATPVGEFSDLPTADEVTEHTTGEIPVKCRQPYNFTILFTAYREENGELIAYNDTKVTHTFKCCDGYVGTSCEVDLCKDLECTEDPNAKCVHVKRCGKRFPIFVNEQGTLSSTCTQPKLSETHLCPNDTCVTGPVCPRPHYDVVCLGNGCGCSGGPSWFLRRNGRQIHCQ